MATLAVELAEAVKTRLDALTFTEEVVIVRGYQPRYDAALPQPVQIAVVAKGEEQQPADRARWRQDIQVDIGIMAKIADPDDAEAVDAVMEEVEVVKAGLKAAAGRTLTLASGSTASLVGIANAPIYDPDLLKGNAFVSLVTATYRVIA